jgi:hypothetical protein
MGPDVLCLGSNLNCPKVAMQFSECSGKDCLIMFYFYQKSISPSLDSSDCLTPPAHSFLAHVALT